MNRRLARISLADTTPYQRRIAVFICDNLLDPFDPTEDHC